MEKLTVNGIDYIRADLAQSPPDVEGLRYAIVRSRDHGVMAGYVQSIEGRQVTLLRGRRLWRWSSRFVLEDLAEFGPTERWKSQFSAERSEPDVMLEACGVLYCTPAAAAAIRAVPPQEPGK